MDLDELIHTLNTTTSEPTPAHPRAAPHLLSPRLATPSPRSPRRFFSPLPSPSPSPAPPGALHEASVPQVIYELEAHAEQLQADGEVDQAIELLHEAWRERVHVYGVESDEVTYATERVVLLVNAVAMPALYAGDDEYALKLLHLADRMCSRVLPGGAVEVISAKVQTLNNWGCCERRLGHPHRAWRLLSESLELCEATHLGGESLAVSHLNLCAILSQLGSHEQAIEHARAAMLHAQEQLLVQSIGDKIAAAQQGRDGDAGRAGASTSQALLGLGYDSAGQHKTYEKVVMLAIAYHNLGVEEEFLGNIEESLQLYHSAVLLADEHLGPKQPMAKSFRESLRAAQQQYQAGTTKKRSKKTKKKTHRRKTSRASRYEGIVDQAALERQNALAGLRDLRPVQGMPPWRPTSSRPASSSKRRKSSTRRKQRRRRH